MTTDKILLITVCCVGLILLQILKYYVIRCHKLERKLRAIYHSELPDLSILANKKTSPTTTAVGIPTINATLPAPSAISGSSVANNVAITNVSASAISTIIAMFPKAVRSMALRIRHVNQDREEPISISDSVKAVIIITRSIY